MWNFKEIMVNNFSKKIQLNKLFFIQLLLLFFVIGLVGSPVFYSCNNNKGPFLSATDKSPLLNSDLQTDAVKMQDAFYNVSKLVNPAVVFIATESIVKIPQMFGFEDFPFFGWGEKQPRMKEQNRIQRGLGSGIIISADGYIVTNHHVVKGAQKIRVKVQNEKEFDAKVIGSDPVLDLSLLKIEAKNLKYAYLGDSDKIRVGDWAIAIGNPFGLSHTFTVGVVSHAGRKNIDPQGVGHYIQTDASINQGNSGGPLLNIRGEVIGINRMIYSSSGGSVGIGFAIPINSAREVIEQLKKNGKVSRGWLGVQVQETISEEFRKELGAKENEGVFVARVVPDSPAAKAGIRERDIILEIDGKKINSFTDLSSQIKLTKPGKTLPLLILRDRKKIKIWVTIQEFSMDQNQ